MSNKMTMERFAQIDELLHEAIHGPRAEDKLLTAAQDLMDEIVRVQHTVAAAKELISTTRFVCPDCAENVCTDIECKCPTYDERATAAMDELEFALTRAGEL